MFAGVLYLSMPEAMDVVRVSCDRLELRIPGPTNNAKYRKCIGPCVAASRAPFAVKSEEITD